MKRLWKKPAVRITAAAAAVIALALLGLWVLSLREPPEMSFDFLQGRDITSQSEDVQVSSHYRMISRYYTLAEDFNDISLSADAEFLKLGYMPYPSTEPAQRQYFKNTRYGESVSIFITYDKKPATIYPNPEPSDYPSFYRDEHDYSKGWVRVYISQSRIRLWPPQHLLYAIKVRFGLARQKP